ncbi:MAG: hypothetical protein IT159_02290 [Bryobacterales bacterium]|nr:hypothetical protein [Bryobacterales bacterium]
MFFKGSRYAKVDELTWTDPAGREVRYKKIRFIPSTTATVGHIVHQGERLDQIAYRYYRDAERFWRIADANLVMWPAELIEEAGRTILIPPAE